MIRGVNLLLLLLAAFYASDVSGKLKSLQISELYCDDEKNPSSVGRSQPDFTWLVTAQERGSEQVAYQVEVASEVELLKTKRADLWDTGKVLSNQTIHVAYAGKELKSNSKYFFQITVWDNHGHRQTSDISNFRTTLLSATDWKAKWIGADSEQEKLPAKGFFSGAKEEGKEGDLIHHDGRSLYLRKSFILQKKIRSARLFICGLGLYELYVNGNRLGDQQLAPAKTPYHKQVLFDTFDVGPMLMAGENSVGIHLGNGWFNPYKKWWQEYRMQWFGSKKAILQLQILYSDNSSQIILTDESWKSSPGPSLYNCIYDGEHYDANLEIANWSSPGLDDSDWKNAELVAPPFGVLSATSMPPIKVIERKSPVTFTTPKPNVRIYNFGQNFSGWVSLTMHGEKGTKLKIRFSEELDKYGNLDVTSNENAKASTEYILKGGKAEKYEPHFTYFGFQYAEISGEPYLPELSDVQGCVVHSNNLPSGVFSCDNLLINQMHHATVWSQKSNMLGYPMDCPQRDERLGWLGDAQVTAEEAMYNFNMSRFYRNWLRGIQLNQDSASGDLPIISPRPYLKDDGIEWSSTYLTMIWDNYRYYGDQRLLEDHYETMTRYFRFLEAKATKDILTKGWIGDWGSRAKDWKEGDPESVPTAYFYWDACLLAKIARLLGKTDDSLFYHRRSEEIKSAYNTAFFHPNKSIYHDGSQMANAFPLFLGLVPEEKKSEVLENLVHQILVTDSSRLSTGVLGTKYMIEALSVLGRPDISWSLVTQKGYPSWDEMMKKYNTMCEFWTLKQSHNHVMMGSVDAWFYDTLAGIRLCEEQPAYKKTTIKPYIPVGLNQVACHLKTIRGDLSSSWAIINGELVLSVNIPFNCQSEVWLPVSRNARVLESGIPADKSKGVTHLGSTGDREIFLLGSGSYQFAVKYPSGKF